MTPADKWTMNPALAAKVQPSETLDYCQPSKDLRSTIDTEGNQWNCDCSIIPFYNFLSNDISSLQRKMIGIVCQSPLYLADTRLIDLELRKRFHSFYFTEHIGS